MTENALRQLQSLANTSNSDNIGDALVKAIVISSAFADPAKLDDAEIYLSKLRDIARKADVGWRVFKTPPKTSHPITDSEAAQLILINFRLHELIYCYERVEEASALTWARSTPVRFYVNSIFHYISTFFLLDLKRNQKAGLPYPGTVIKVFHPLGCDDLLNPIYQILDTSFGTTTFRETIRRVRNSQFVHGTFSPNDIKKLVKETRIHEIKQQLLFNSLQWRLFHQIVVLRLKIIALLTDANIDPSTFSHQFVDLYKTQ